MGSILWDFLWWNMRRRIGNLWKLCKTTRLRLLPEACCNAMHAMHLFCSGSWYIGGKGHSFSLIAGCACLLWRCEDMGNKNVFSHSHHFFTLQHLDRICTLPLQSSMSSFTDFNYFFFSLTAWKFPSLIFKGPQTKGVCLCVIWGPLVQTARQQHESQFAVVQELVLQAVLLRRTLLCEAVVTHLHAALPPIPACPHLATPISSHRLLPLPWCNCTCNCFLI